MTYFSLKSSTLLALGLALTACGNSKSQPPPDGQTVANRSPYVRFAVPSAGAKVHGVTDLRIDTNLGHETGSLTLMVGGETIAVYEQLGAAILLDTTRFADGAVTLRLQATTEQGDIYTDELPIEIDNPAHRFISATNDRRAYGRGEQIKIALVYSEAGLTLTPDFSVVDSAFNSSAVRIDDLGGGHYEVSYTLSERDDKEPLNYEVPITSTGRDSPSLVAHVNVQFLGAPRLPIAVSAPNAVFSDRTIPLELSRSAPLIESMVVPERLIQGQPQTITIRWSASPEDPADRIVLSSSASSGTWVIPLGEPSTNGEMTIPIEAVGSPGQLTTTSIPLSAAALGTSGTTRAATLTDMEVITMQLFGVKVLLNWSTSADLDLEVTTPDGSLINFMSPEAQGGVLELDANSTCTSHADLPMESISWPAKNLVPGNYGIRVSQFDSCDATDTNYTVTVLACGRATTIPGTFGKFDAATIQERDLPPYVLDCIRRLHGRVTFEKQGLDGSGYVPAVNVPLHVTGTGFSNDVTTTTDDNGQYAVSFPTADVANVMVHVGATWTPPGATAPRAQVWQLTGSSPYDVVSHIGTIPSLDLEYDLAIDRGNNSGAFNILDVMRKAAIWKDTMFSSADAAKVTPLVARWSNGVGTPSKSGGSYYSCRTDDSDCGPQSRAIWLGGASNNQSEFADPVIAHEASHHTAAMLQVDNSQGGPHGFSGRIAPAFAWSEGLATGLGQNILDRPAYWSGPPDARAYVNVESTPSTSANGATMDSTLGWAYGTTPANDMNGQVNEFLVAGILFDLLDPANEPGNDEITSSPYSVSRTLAHFLSTPLLLARGDNGIDLVDFLDGWRCYRARLFKEAGLRYSDAELATLLSYRKFAYTIPTTDTVCF